MKATSVMTTRAVPKGLSTGPTRSLSMLIGVAGGLHHLYFPDVVGRGVGRRDAPETPYPTARWRLVASAIPPRTAPPDVGEVFWCSWR